MLRCNSRSALRREGAGAAEFVHLHGMIDHQLGGKQRIDFLRIAAEFAHGVAHGGQIDDGGHAGEILQAARARA